MNAGDWSHLPGVVLFIKDGPCDNLILLLQRDKVLNDQLPAGIDTEDKRWRSAGTVQ